MGRRGQVRAVIKRPLEALTDNYIKLRAFTQSGFMDMEYSSKIRTGRFGMEGKVRTMYNRPLEAETGYNVKVWAFTQSGFMDAKYSSKIRTGRFEEQVLWNILWGSFLGMLLPCRRKCVSNNGRELYRLNMP